VGAGRRPNTVPLLSHGFHCTVLPRLIHPYAYCRGYAGLARLSGSNKGKATLAKAPRPAPALRPAPPQAGTLVLKPKPALQAPKTSAGTWFNLGTTMISQVGEGDEALRK